MQLCRSQCPRGLRRGSAAAFLLRLWVRIPLGAWMSVCCDCCMLLGRGLCDELITLPEESYRLWWVVVCDLETSWMRRPWPTGGCCTRNKQCAVFIYLNLVKCSRNMIKVFRISSWLFFWVNFCKIYQLKSPTSLCLTVSCVTWRMNMIWEKILSLRSPSLAVRTMQVPGLLQDQIPYISIPSFSSAATKKHFLQIIFSVIYPLLSWLSNGSFSFLDIHK
jgi:hypothetical protein